MFFAGSPASELLVLLHMLLICNLLHWLYTHPSHVRHSVLQIIPPLLAVENSQSCGTSLGQLWTGKYREITVSMMIQMYGFMCKGGLVDCAADRRGLQ